MFCGDKTFIEYNNTVPIVTFFENLKKIYLFVNRITKYGIGLDR